VLHMKKVHCHDSLPNTNNFYLMLFTYFIMMGALQVGSVVGDSHMRTK